ncbi:hypothetical protein HHI36_020120 [Cryptolaemus montrouzieri]|uniref:Protein kinase domain-containing protein n=1 Tax=Cryptolaemus montrouzieri TaxID=559131 RepID=A0ABD2N9A0_9CUCU
MRTRENKEVKRPITKVCPLLINDSYSENSNQPTTTESKSSVNFVQSALVTSIDSGIYIEHINIPDLVCQEFPSSPQRPLGFVKEERPPRPSLNFLPDPPDGPPPDNFYPNGFVSPIPLNSPSLTPPPTFHMLGHERNFALPLSPVLPEPSSSVIEVFPRDQLRIIEKLGDGQYCNVHLCEVSDSYSGTRRYPLDCKYVVVHTLRVECYKRDFNVEVSALSRLSNANVARLLGACLDSEPVCAVREYAPFGDLCQFLQDHVAETATPLAPTASTLSYGCLIFMATQISSGMKYLESLGFVHKDLATRNCLVGKSYEIKISDVGSYRQMYSSDYYQIPGSRPLPVRWMAWESILLGKFSSKSDVWSFAVTLWEILTFAREQPYEELSDEKVIENVTRFYQNHGNQIVLNIPINCSKEIFDLMCECWQRNDSDRPNFREIHLFLQRKNLGYSPDLH